MALPVGVILEQDAAAKAQSSEPSADEEGLFRQQAPGARPRRIQERLGETVSVKDFGATGNGVADDTAAIQAAVAFCQGTLRTLQFPPGTYRLTETLRITGSAGGPIALVGDEVAPMQQGSAGPAVILRWHGAAQPMIRCDISGVSFVGFALQNFGAATDAIHLAGGQHYVLRRLSFLCPSEAGAARFSRSCLYSEAGSLGYGRLQSIWFGGAAPRFALIDGSAHYAGGTPFAVSDRCIFESNAASGPVTIFHLRAQDYDAMAIRDCTFNGQENAGLTILDTTDTPRLVVMSSFVFEGNEIDLVSNRVADRTFRLRNLQNIEMNRNVVQGGSVAHICELYNSSVTSFAGNYAMSVSGTFFHADPTSRVRLGPNVFEKANTGGYVNAGAASGVIPLPVDRGGIARIFLDFGDPSGLTVFRLTLGHGNEPRYVTVASETDSVRGIRTPGQTFVLELRNEGRERLTAPAPAGVWKLQGGAFPTPAAGSTIALTCVWDGAAVRELGRSGEVPN